jgi:hypothetical protein
MWRLGKFFALSPAALGDLRLGSFLSAAAVFFFLGYIGKLPRTHRYYVPEGTISDIEVPAGA